MALKCFLSFSNFESYKKCRPWWDGIIHWTFISERSNLEYGHIRTHFSRLLWHGKNIKCRTLFAFYAYTLHFLSSPTYVFYFSYCVIITYFLIIFLFLINLRDSNPWDWTEKNIIPTPTIVSSGWKGYAAYGRISFSSFYHEIWQFWTPQQKSKLALFS